MFRKLFSLRRSFTPRKTGRPRRLGIESLEDRTTPSLMVALTTNDRLLTFDNVNPNHILRSVQLTGLANGEDVRGLDSRPANGLLYGVTNFNRLYTINAFTGVATLVGAGTPFAVPLNGTSVGFDFNPTVDRIRVATNTEQNLRLNPNDGTTVDGNANVAGIQPDTPLAYAMGDRFQNVNPNIVAAAYTNNFLGATTTTLYAIDSNTDSLVAIGGLNGQPSPNGGQLFTIGSLGVPVGSVSAFEINANGVAYAAIQTNLGPFPTLFYTIDLNSGRATLLGRIGNGAAVDGLAELPRDEIVYGVTASNRLIRFRASDPGTVLTTVPISNLQMGENVVALDVRTATGELFVLTSTNRLLRIEPETGLGIQVGNPVDPTLLATGSIGFDFNPTVDRLRLVNDGNDNLRFNPVTFTPVDGDANTAGIQGDTDLAYIAGDPGAGQDPNIVASAYDRNDNDPATPTTLFGIDSTRNVLVRQGAVDGNPNGPGGSPNGGLLTTIGALGVNPTDMASFDISGNGFGGNGVALAALQLEGEMMSKLYTVNLTTGALTLVGTIGGGELIRAMTIAPTRVSFSAPSYVVTENGRFATVIVRRTGGSGGPATVQLTTSDGTARAGLDYTAVNMMLRFAPGETAKFVQIPILDDRTPEPIKTVNLTLSAPTGGGTLLGAQVTAVLSIIDDDLTGFGGLRLRRRM
jgi:hypothetical protein